MTAMLAHDAGVLCAPTAFGKTVTAAAMIARRAVNTLVLVHRTELLKQWQERLQSFLGVGKGMVGTIGGGKSKPTGKIDIAVMQSLSRQGEINPVVEDYGHVIIDESGSSILWIPDTRRCCGCGTSGSVDIGQWATGLWNTRGRRQTCSLVPIASSSEAKAITAAHRRPWFQSAHPSDSQFHLSGSSGGLCRSHLPRQL